MLTYSYRWGRGKHAAACCFQPFPQESLNGLGENKVFIMATQVFTTKKAMEAAGFSLVSTPYSHLLLLAQKSSSHT